MPSCEGTAFTDCCMKRAREASRLCVGQDRTSVPRIISICVESRPEVAAIVGQRPVTVTSGATPLEGLPGARACGELDPSIVISLSHDRQWGPEQIHNVLIQRSGLSALLGRPVHLESLDRLKTPNGNAVREYFQYQLLKACGSAIAAMSGVDALVFSGRAAKLGELFGPWLVDRLNPLGLHRKRPVFWTCFSDTVERVIADTASTMFLSVKDKIAVYGSRSY